MKWRSPAILVDIRVAVRAFWRRSGRIARRFADRYGPRPVLSVVTPYYNVESYVGECLTSVLSQDFASIEVLIVDDGSTDRSAAIVASYAARDRRIRVFRQENAGQGPARNLGVSKARGRFIVFVDSDDVVPPGSFRYLVAALRASGSDFAVAGVRRLQNGRTYRPSWTPVIHEHDRVGITIDDFPAAMSDVVAHHRIFRRQFWTKRVGGFAAGIYEDHVPMVVAYLRARRFDVLSRVTYDWRLREEGTSTGQQKHDVGNLEARIAVTDEARELVWREASPPVRAAWVGRVLDVDFPPYIDHALRADDRYRATLQRVLSRYVALTSAPALARVRVQQKIRTYLASRGAWRDLEIAQRHFREQSSIPATLLRDGRVVLADALLDVLDTIVPPEMLELGASESRMQVCLLRAEWLDRSRLRLTGWAIARAVDLTDRTPAIALWLTSANGVHRVDLAVERVNLVEATRWVNWAHGSFERAGFRTIVDVDRLGAEGAGDDWRLCARLEVDGMVREGRAYHAVAGSSAARAAVEPQRHGASKFRVIPYFDPQHGFTLSRRRPGAAGARPEPNAASLVVHAAAAGRGELRFVVRDRALPSIHAVRLTDDRVEVAPSSTAPGEGGAYELAIPTRRPDEPQRALPSGAWSLAAVSASGGKWQDVALDRHLAASFPREEVNDTHRVRFALVSGRAMRVELSAPLDDDELGARAQQLLREAYTAFEGSAVDHALFVPPEATSAGCDALRLLATTLGRRRPDLPRRWTVPDLSAEIPRSMEAVLAGSRAWYSRLAAARWLWMQADLAGWFSKRSFQRVVRVFDDASPSIGRAAWWAAGWTPGQIDHETQRLSAGWDAIVVPDASCVDRYRDELEYRGPVLALGNEGPDRIVDAILALGLEGDPPLRR